MQVADAALIPGQSLCQFMVNHLLDGKLRVCMVLDGVHCHGSVCALEYAEGSDFALARVWVVKIPEPVFVNVAIHRDGRVTVVPQDEEG